MCPRAPCEQATKQKDNAADKTERKAQFARPGEDSAANDQVTGGPPYQVSGDKCLTTVIGGGINSHGPREFNVDPSPGVK
jgi:hypothetical protein